MLPSYYDAWRLRGYDEDPDDFDEDADIGEIDHATDPPAQVVPLLGRAVLDRQLPPRAADSDDPTNA